MNDFINWCRRYLSFTLLAALIVLSIVLFFNENSLISTIGQERRIDELNAMIEEATDTLVYYRDLNRSRTIRSIVSRSLLSERLRSR